MTGGERLLRSAFLLGAAADAGSLPPMLAGRLAGLLWGFKGSGGDYRFAMRMGASLMSAWTALLIWAARRPLERRAVAPLTLGIIAGFVAAESLALRKGELDLRKALPLFSMQAALGLLFAAGYLMVVQDARERGL